MGDVTALARRTTMLRAVAFVGVSEVAAKCGIVVATLLVARALGAEVFGQWSLAVALTGVIGLLSDAGLTNALQRRIARGDEDPATLVGNASAMKLLASAAAVVPLAIAASLGGRSVALSLTILLLGCFSITTTSALMVQGVFRATAASQLDALTRIVQQLLLLASVAVLALAGSGMVAFGVGYACAGVAGLALSIIVLRRSLTAGLRFDLPMWRSLAVDAWPFWIAGIFWIAYFRIDVVILSYLSTDRQTGLYNMAYNGFQVLTLPAAVLAAALYPSLSHLHGADRARFARVRGHAQAITMAAGACIAALAVLLVDPVIRLVAGGDYASATLLFRALAPAAVFLYPNYALFQSLSAAGKQRLVMVAAGVGALSNVSLNLALVPWLDALGASISTVGTEALVFGVLSLMAWRVLGEKRQREPVSVAVLPASVPAREPEPSGGQRAA